MNYGVLFWGNSSYCIRVFRLQKYMIRIIPGCKSRDSCRNLFKELNILPVLSLYVCTYAYTHTHTHTYIFQSWFKFESSLKNRLHMYSFYSLHEYFHSHHNLKFCNIYVGNTNKMHMYVMYIKLYSTYFEHTIVHNQVVCTSSLQYFTMHLYEESIRWHDMIEFIKMHGKIL